MEGEIATIFDYSQLDTSTRIVVQQEDKEFDRNMGEANGSFIYACKNLQRIQEALRYRRPGFAEYCNNKPGLSSSTAYRMLSVAKMFPESGNIPIQSREAIYLLAEPSTPELIRQEIIEEAESGKKITSTEVKTRKATGGIPKTTIEPLIADTAPVRLPSRAAYSSSDNQVTRGDDTSQVNQDNDYNQTGTRSEVERVNGFTLEQVIDMLSQFKNMNEVCHYCEKPF